MVSVVGPGAGVGAEAWSLPFVMIGEMDGEGEEEARAEMDSWIEEPQTAWASLPPLQTELHGVENEHAVF